MRTNRHDPPYPVGGGGAAAGRLIDALRATVPIAMRAIRERVPDDWDRFHISPDGEAVAVIL